jgi:hypothetical protein
MHSRLWGTKESGDSTVDEEASKAFAHGSRKQQEHRRLAVQAAKDDWSAAAGGASTVRSPKKKTARTAADTAHALVGGR